ncbi:MAG: hypothetical protein RL172_2982 [Bacteroidota bacterium]
MNIPGWRSSQKYVVIESDDWGTIRTSSREALAQLHQKGYPVLEGAYCKYDALECNQDLEQLYEVLSSVKDANGNPAVITANNIVANPDFEKIKAASFKKYFFEPFTQTLQQYTAHNNVFSLYQQGILAGVFWPQFHGREHVNVGRWLRALQAGSKPVHDAFDCKMFSMHVMLQPAYFNVYMDALDCDGPEDLANTTALLTEGLQLFEDTWGFKSRSFIAPCYIWRSEHEAAVAAAGVKYLQGLPYQYQPKLQPGTSYQKKYHTAGSRNTLGQRYLVRNAFFEPTPYPAINWVDECLYRIETAFRWGKPAIISSHRLNFMGQLYPENREKNLRLLKKLLQTITQKWPEVMFVSSDELGDIFAGIPSLRHLPKN